MNILSIDTSTHHLSVALGKDAKVVAYRNFVSKRRISETFFERLEAFLKLKKIKWKDVDGFIVGLGPGAFTSMRVGIASVQGLAFALKKPVAGVCSLDAVAMEAGEHPSICVMNDARRDLLYTGHYSLQKGILKPTRDAQLVPVKQVLQNIKTKTLFIGSGVGIHQEALTKFKYTDQLISKDIVQARYLLPLGYPLLKKKTKKRLTPMYLYAEDCQVQR